MFITALTSFRRVFFRHSTLCTVLAAVRQGQWLTPRFPVGTNSRNVLSLIFSDLVLLALAVNSFQYSLYKGFLNLSYSDWCVLGNLHRFNVHTLILSFKHLVTYALCNLHECNDPAWYFPRKRWLGYLWLIDTEASPRKNRDRGTRSITRP